jgi:ubiquinone/menaquinone biosynthesis C-methylase UbiE
VDLTDHGGGRAGGHAEAGPRRAAVVKSRFRAITETADTRADADQLAMAQLRHSLVAVLASGRDLLDVACGSGYALPLIAREARSVTACDRDSVNIQDATQALPSGQFFVCDAERLRFGENSFDVVACLEAIYYFEDWRGFVRATGRMLRPGGAAVITWPNPARPAFSRSPSSTVYPTAEQMLATAEAAGFDGVCYGAFPLGDLATARRPLLDAIRRAAVGLHLIPSSLRLRMLIKRVLYRRMKPLSQLRLLPDPFQHLVKLRPGESVGFAMLYFVGTRNSEAAR